jgi:hypothetical protein
MEDAFRELRDAIKKGDAQSFKMFEKYDDLTVRDYLSQIMYDLLGTYVVAI